MAPSLEATICAYGWNCETALRIAQCESELLPRAISWTGDSYGLFQIHRETWEAWLNRRGFDFESSWWVAERNIAMAYEVWLEQGWAEWDCWEG